MSCYKVHQHVLHSLFRVYICRAFVLLVFTLHKGIIFIIWDTFALSVIFRAFYMYLLKGIIISLNLSEKCKEMVLIIY